MSTATAHPGEDINLYPVGRAMGRRKGVHAVLDHAVRIASRGPDRGVVRAPGEAACGQPGGYTDPPEALFAAFITCANCVVLARAEGIEIIGGSL